MGTRTEAGGQWGRRPFSPCGRRWLSEAKSDEGYEDADALGEQMSQWKDRESPLTRSRKDDGCAAVRDLPLPQGGEGFA